MRIFYFILLYKVISTGYPRHTLKEPLLCDRQSCQKWTEEGSVLGRRTENVKNKMKNNALK